MNWLNSITTIIIFFVIMDWLANDSYHRLLFKKNRQLDKPYFKSKLHKIYHHLVNVLIIIGATLVVVRWIFF